MNIEKFIQLDTTGGKNAAPTFLWCAMNQLQRRNSLRLEGYDYSQNGAYFVTICTVHREPLFGDVVDSQLQSSPLGQIASEELGRVPSYWTDVEIDHFVVMPNHIHVIILIITAQPNDQSNQPVGAAFLPPASSPKANPPTLGKIIAGYKAGVTRAARQQNLFDEGAAIWQRGYHDHIIRNESALDTLHHYIETNPARWEVDSLRPDGASL